MALEASRYVFEWTVLEEEASLYVIECSESSLVSPTSVCGCSVDNDA